MITTVLTGLAGNVVVGWIRRRLLELVGIIGAIIPFIMAMDPEQQGVLVAILSGQGGSLSLATYAAFAVYIFSQWRSWRATVNPQVVTADLQRVELTEAQAREITGHTGPIENRSGRR